MALLLPDGRVVTASGNPNKGSQVNWIPPDPLEERLGPVLEIDLFHAGHGGRGRRPRDRDRVGDHAAGRAVVDDVLQVQAGELVKQFTDASLHGPTWLTGGSVGPEASIFDFALLFILFYVIHRLYPENKSPQQAASYIYRTNSEANTNFTP